MPAHHEHSCKNRNVILWLSLNLSMFVNKANRHWRTLETLTSETSTACLNSAGLQGPCSYEVPPLLLAIFKHHLSAQLPWFWTLTIIRTNRAMLSVAKLRLLLFPASHHRLRDLQKAKRIRHYMRVALEADKLSQTHRLEKLAAEKNWDQIRQGKLHVRSVVLIPIL